MDSPWQNPLPTGERKTSPVVVCYYSDFWIPISYFSYGEAIALHQKARRQGKEILVFPPGLNLETKNILLPEASGLQDELVSRLTRC
ncbi:MAG TPA: hypothetical protein V6C90_00115 [Coleofasciculaceae cyanobacterium]